MQYQIVRGGRINTSPSKPYTYEQAGTRHRSDFCDRKNSVTAPARCDSGGILTRGLRSGLLELSNIGAVALTHTRAAQSRPDGKQNDPRRIVFDHSSFPPLAEYCTPCMASEPKKAQKRTYMAPKGGPAHTRVGNEFQAAIPDFQPLVGLPQARGGSASAASPLSQASVSAVLLSSDGQSETKIANVELQNSILSNGRSSTEIDDDMHTGHGTDSAGTSPLNAAIAGDRPLSGAVKRAHEDIVLAVHAGVDTSSSASSDSALTVPAKRGKTEPRHEPSGAI